MVARLQERYSYESHGCESYSYEADVGLLFIYNPLAA